MRYCKEEDAREKNIEDLKIYCQDPLKLDQNQVNEMVKFLHAKLERFGDDLESIQACFDYLTTPGKGGHLIVAKSGGKLAGLTAILNTHMSRFLPESFLVYIAVDPAFRGQGLGKKILDKAKEQVKGGIALHVEPDNPAKKLYEREGFTNKYLEMRYNPEK